MVKIYQVQVYGLEGDMKTVNLGTEEQFKSVTVLQLKEKIKERFCWDITVDDFDLIFMDKRLEEDSTPLCEYGIQRMSVILCVIIVRGGGPGPPEKGDGGMGDKGGKNQSMERLASF